ncbi:MAG TPA: hypothetical protein VE547_19285 [Mycobacteriales bacterium]|nr:hypothetical protein [Mycobacteriales bacterium]
MPEREQQQVPGTVRAAALLVALEGAALIGLALVEVLLTVLGDPSDIGLALVTAGFAAAGGVLLVLLARAMLRLRKAARAPVAVVQLIALPIGWNLIEPSGRPELGVPVLVLAAAVLVLLGTPAARAALARD